MSERTEIERGRGMDWEGFFTSYRTPGFVPGYEIVNKLGSGVFGEVFKARKESIGKFYAIKFLKISDERVAEAIFKELDGLRYFAQLDHPNLVSIEDRGEVLGIPYIVMGYGGDATLKSLLRERRLEPHEVDALFRQIAQGVAALHRHSIIHFDLKPANVFLNGSHARVGDYGLSKLVSESRKTMSIGRGTPYYMAPEILRRQGDRRSDVYSLGVILFEMLTGEVPFTGDSEWEVLRKHETDPVDVPPDVEDRWRKVLLRALEKQPERRFASVDEMLAAASGEVLPAAEARAPVAAATGARGVMPPPLPSGRRGDGSPPPPLTAAVERIRSSGGAVEPRRAGTWSDLDDARGAISVPAPRATPRAPDALAADRAILSWIVRILLAPFRWLGRGVRIVLHNVIRYALILAITALLMFVVHGAIRGFQLSL